MILIVFSENQFRLVPIPRDKVAWKTIRESEPVYCRRHACMHRNGRISIGSDRVAHADQICANCGLLWIVHNFGQCLPA